MDIRPCPPVWVLALLLFFATFLDQVFLVFHLCLQEVLVATEQRLSKTWPSSSARPSGSRPSTPTRGGWADSVSFLYL